MKDIVRVLRVIEYVGEREWVERTIERSIHGTMKCGQGEIRAAVVGAFPEVLRDLPVDSHASNFIGVD